MALSSSLGIPGPRRQPSQLITRNHVHLCPYLQQYASEAPKPPSVMALKEKHSANCWMRTSQETVMVVSQANAWRRRLETVMVVSKA